MAELVIGAVGLVSLASLFETCVDAFSYIQLGHNFSNDYQNSILQLRLIQLSLTRWGEAVNINTQYLIQQEPLIRPVLANILNTIKDAERISSKYAGQHNILDAKLQQQDSTEEICSKVAKLVMARQKKTTLVKKVCWAIYHKEHFDSLIKVTSGLVRQLVELFPAAQATQSQLCVHDLAQITQKDNATQLQLIQHVSLPVDRPMSEAAGAKLVELTGHQYFGNLASGKARARYGDTYDDAPAQVVVSTSHVFENNTATDNARAVYGNHIGSLRDFWAD